MVAQGQSTETKAAAMKREAFVRPECWNQLYTLNHGIVALDSGSPG